MTFRQIRRKLTPERLGVDARRRWRDVVYRKLGIARCHVPPLLVRQPQLTIGSPLRYVVAEALLHNPDFTFLQIGAFDGEGDDDLRALIVEYGLRGVLVEPQPAAFARLCETYCDQPQVTLLEAAIAERPGTRDFYCRRGEASMAASFDRRHLTKHGIADAEIVALPVACHTIDTALAVAGLERVDLIQIDAEGYDYQIIRTINFARVRPAIVRFEYRHMTGREADACLALLAGHGYRFLVEPRDITACRVAATPAHRSQAA